MRAREGICDIVREGQLAFPLFIFGKPLRQLCWVVEIL